jgi:RNA polymerase sigma-70 factor (ECF subfamily)
MTMWIDDVALMARSADGDQEAFALLMNRHAEDLRGFCRRFARNPHDAADLHQEALLKAWRHRHAFDGRSTVRTWLYRIVANAAIDEHRRRERRPELPGFLPEQAGSERSPEDVVVDTEALRWALARLPEHFRVVVVLADGMGWAYPDIAARCGIAEATVRSRLSRARAQLRSLLSAR